MSTRNAFPKDKPKPNSMDDIQQEQYILLATNVVEVVKN